MFPINRDTFRRGSDEPREPVKLACSPRRHRFRTEGHVCASPRSRLRSPSLEVFRDRVIDTPIRDRVLHHAVTSNIVGNFFRPRYKGKARAGRAEEPVSTN